MSISKGNQSSTDNTLAFPIKPVKMLQTRNVPNETFNYPQSPRKPNSHSETSMYSIKENIPVVNTPQPTKTQTNHQQSQSEPFFMSGNVPSKYSETDKYLKANQPFQSTSIPNFVNKNTNQSTSNVKFESPSTGFIQRRTPSQTEIRQDVSSFNKQAYKNALDQQVMEKEMNKFEQNKANKKTEIEIMSQYPFGRRTDPYSFLPNNYVKYSQAEPDLGYKAPYYRDEMTTPRYDKNNIVEKPNSLSADIPPYDPIKHRNGFQQGYNYDPTNYLIKSKKWGKPGGGAPMIDPGTGRKYTKITGQLGWDQLGLSPDKRAEMARMRPATLEEQKYDMSIERERKRVENENYKARAGDVATWISALENARLTNLNNNNGAHLSVTNVTREKINLESVRRQNDNAKTYHDELAKQLEERNRQTKLHKLKDDVAGIEHTKKWDDWWGKPGGGAPLIQTNRRRDLTEVLESPREYVGPATSLQIGSPRLNKFEAMFPRTTSTFKSNHANLYDNITAMKL